MRRIPALLVLLTLGSLVACSDDDSTPTGPGSPTRETISVLEYTITVTRFECIADGDGIEGAGEFDFIVYAGRSGQKSWERTLSSGQSATLDWSWTEGTPGYEGDPVPFEIRFRCTEWDRDVFGQVYPDSDMDDREVIATEMVTEGRIVNYITMGNSQCKVRLHYEIVATVIEIELENT